MYSSGDILTLGILRHLCDVRIRERLGCFPSILPRNSSFYNISFNYVSILIFYKCFVSHTNLIVLGLDLCKYVFYHTASAVH